MAEAIRILFVGVLHSSHALSWIGMLSSQPQRFAVHGVTLWPCLPQVNFPIQIAAHPDMSFWGRCKRRFFRRQCREWAQPVRGVYAPYGDPEIQYPELLGALSAFKPHIVHTFGFAPSALLYGSLPEALRSPCRWVLQTRGGSDVAFTKGDPEWQGLFRRFLPQADIVLCDNLENYRIFSDLNITLHRAPLIPFVPGTGGMDFDELSPGKDIRARQKIIVWNKAYESPWSKALPVLEGLRMAWDHIMPDRCIFTATDDEVRQHVHLLPPFMQERIELHGRIPRVELLAFMREAKVVLAPSLVDGIPNTLYEAMACGALPIVSPLESITPHFEEGENVFYARNLFPEEISGALIRAFSSSAADAMTHANLALARRMADRKVISEKIKAMYASLASQ